MFSLKRLEIHKIYHESTKRTKEEKKSDLTAFLLQKFNFSNNDKYIKNINSQFESLFLSDIYLNGNKVHEIMIVS